MATKVGIALFGLGRMGLQHARNILMSPRARLQWIVCENVEEARRLKADYDLDVNVTTPDNASHALGDSNVDAVMVVSPSKTHEGFIKDSLDADKSVFCEKPLTSDIKTTRECYEMAEKKRKPLFCAFQRRFDPSFNQIYQALRAGKYGQARILKTTSRDFQYPPVDYLRTSGGIFKDSTIHDLDISGWLMGAKPTSVFAHGNAFNAELKAFNDNDQVVVIVTFDNGSISVIDNGRMSPTGYENRLEILCDKAQISVGNKPSDLLTSLEPEVTPQPRIVTGFVDRYHEAYNNELNHFLDVIQGKCELLITKKDTLQAMTLSELCYKSLQQGKTVNYVETV